MVYFAVTDQMEQRHDSITEANREEMIACVCVLFIQAALNYREPFVSKEQSAVTLTTVCCIRNIQGFLIVSHFKTVDGVIDS